MKFDVLELFLYHVRDQYLFPFTEVGLPTHLLETHGL